MLKESVSCLGPRYSAPHRPPWALQLFSDHLQIVTGLLGPYLRTALKLSRFYALILKSALLIKLITVVPGNSKNFRIPKYYLQAHCCSRRLRFSLMLSGILRIVKVLFIFMMADPGRKLFKGFQEGFVWDYPHHKVLRAKFLSSWLSVSKVIIELIKVPGINPSRYQSSSHQSLPFSNASDGPLGLLSYSRTLHHELSFTNSLHALSSLHLLAVLYVSWRMGDVAQHG